MRNFAHERPLPFVWHILAFGVSQYNYWYPFKGFIQWKLKEIITCSDWMSSLGVDEKVEWSTALIIPRPNQLNSYYVIISVIESWLTQRPRPSRHRRGTPRSGGGTRRSRCWCSSPVQQSKQDFRNQTFSIIDPYPSTSNTPCHQQ